MIQKFVSYAQNCEDVFIHRCFYNQAKGIYIDVGASSPVRDSVTFASYERGWSGFNIEPIPERVAELRRLRPRDVTIQAAAGEDSGTLSLYRTEGVGGLSSVNREMVEAHALRGRPVEEIIVPVLTLDELCDRHCIENIDFLKIDAEGHEANVLRGFSFQRCRPRLLIIESIDPITHADNSAPWLPLIDAAGYVQAYSDGLNRFFVRWESRELLENFAAPINVLDNIINFAASGSAINRFDHPDHQWAGKLAAAMLRYAMRAPESQLAEILSLDVPNLDSPATLPRVNESYLLALDRTASPSEIADLTSRADYSVLTIRDVVLELISSDNFRLRLARATAWV